MCICSSTVAKKCLCSNGVASTGDKCPSDGAKVCEKCNSGFKLTHAFNTAARITSSQKPWENTKWGYGAGDRDKPWTVRLWVKRDSSLKRSGDNMCAIFSGDSPFCRNDVPPQALDKYGNSCGAYGFAIYDHKGKWDVYYGTHYKKLSGKPLGVPWVRAETGKSVVPNVWQQWTVAFKGQSGKGDLYFYLDGELVYSTEGVARKSWAPNTFNQRPVYIGREGYVSVLCVCVLFGIIMLKMFVFGYVSGTGRQGTVGNTGVDTWTSMSSSKSISTRVKSSKSLSKATPTVVVQKWNDWGTGADKLSVLCSKSR